MRSSLRHLGAFVFTALLLAGHILDTTTGQPLSGVHVELTGPSHASTASDKHGHFFLRDLKPGRYVLVLESADVPKQRFTVTLTAHKPTTTVELHACSTTLDYECGTPNNGGSGAGR